MIARKENHDRARRAGAYRGHNPGRDRPREPVVPAGRPLIRVGVGDRPDPVTAAIARHITQSGSVFLELPDGRLTIVLHLDGKTRVAQSCDQGTRGLPEFMDPGTAGG